MSFSDLVIDALTDAGNHFDVSGILETSKYASEGSQTRTRFPHQVFAPGQVSSFIKIWAQFVWLLFGVAGAQLEHMLSDARGALGAREGRFGHFDVSGILETWKFHGRMKSHF